ncbi:HEAT repeat domain-containing protein [Lysobacter korlensis]|uniref:HEAT repeat domain-containing protein n=1 Tax=Lysobacter korlensis TaxID=553636 RepID=A0ABV6S0Y0_9GAMM
MLAALKSQEPTERNAAAIALMDLGNSSAVEPLIAAIEHPDNRDARGSLIYALSELDCQGRFAQLFRWAAEGGYEATGEALSIISQQQLHPTKQDLVACNAVLSTVETPDREYLLELLSQVNGHEG